MSKKFRFLSCLIAVFALALMAVSPIAYAGPEKGDGQETAPGQEKKEEATSESSGTESSDTESSSTESSSASDDSRSRASSSSDAQGSKKPSRDESSSSSSSSSESTSAPENSANSPAPSGSGSGQPAQGCDQADAGYDHAYASTCDGRASENGSGDGKASGRPCMGCVGAADNKNPNGQRPNGSDHNNGYECDGNNGIGKGNPAHTDCQPSGISTPPKTCPNGSQMPANGKCDDVLGEVITKTCPNGSAMPANGVCNKDVVCPAGTVMDASGNCLEVNPSVPDKVKGEIIERAENPARVLGIRVSPALAQPVAVAGAVLPFTGGEALTFLVAAFALILAGAAFLMFRRSEA